MVWGQSPRWVLLHKPHYKRPFEGVAPPYQLAHERTQETLHMDTLRHVHPRRPHAHTFAQPDVVRPHED